MLKQLSAVCLFLVFSFVLLCSCKPSETQGNSSFASSESAYSEIETSSEAWTENSQDNNVQSDSKGSSSKKEESTSSEKQENNSSKDSSSKKQSSVKPSSSKKEYENKIEPIASNNNKTSSSKVNNDSTSTSSSKSEEIKKNVAPEDALQIGAFHFNPKWTVNYGKDDESRMQELSDVLSAGYFNTFQVELDYAANQEMWEICVENDVSVWILLYEYYDSSDGVTIDEYISEVDKAVSVIKSNPKYWDNFCGFAFEESVWRGQTNADFLKESEALYKKYGKRNHVVLATGEFTGVEGNELQLGVTADQMKKILPSSFKYCTDVAFDSYGVDVRDGAKNGNKYKEWQSVSSNIVDGKSYYIEHTKLLVRLAGHDVNVWFYPCAYSTNLWGGLNGLYRADEEYCLAHLNFFDELLKEQEFQGGLILYTYTQFSNVNEIGLQSRLSVKNASGKQLIRPNETKWTKYSARVKELTTEYKQTKARLAA